MSRVSCPQVILRGGSLAVSSTMPPRRKLCAVCKSLKTMREFCPTQWNQTPDRDRTCLACRPVDARLQGKALPEKVPFLVLTYFSRQSLQTMVLSKRVFRLHVGKGRFGSVMGMYTDEAMPRLGYWCSSLTVRVKNLLFPGGLETCCNSDPARDGLKSFGCSPGKLATAGHHRVQDLGTFRLRVVLFACGPEGCRTQSVLLGMPITSIPGRGLHQPSTARAVGKILPRED